MRAIILAAGEGNRLKPLTNDCPKGMIELAGKSLLKRQIETFRKCQINEISIVTGYLADRINFPDISYFRNKKYDSTNMVETLFCAREMMNDSIIVSYGDIIFEVKVLKKLIEYKDNISVIIDKNWKKYWELRFSDPLKDAESLIIDNKGFIRSIGQKVNNIADIQGQYIGLMKFQGKGLKDLKMFYEMVQKNARKNVNLLNPKVSFEKSYMTDLLQALINQDIKIKAVPIESGWLELDSMSDYSLYQKKIQDGTLSEIFSFDD